MDKDTIINKSLAYFMVAQIIVSIILYFFACYFSLFYIGIYKKAIEKINPCSYILLISSAWLSFINEIIIMQLKKKANNKPTHRHIKLFENIIDILNYVFLFALAVIIVINYVYK